MLKMYTFKSNRVHLHMLLNLETIMFSSFLFESRSSSVRMDGDAYMNFNVHFSLLVRFEMNMIDQNHSLWFNV